MIQLSLLAVVTVSVMIPCSVYGEGLGGCGNVDFDLDQSKNEAEVVASPWNPILWENGQVNYVYDLNTMHPDEVYTVELAMRTISQAVPCIRFVNRPAGPLNTVTIQKDCACYSTCELRGAYNYVAGVALIGKGQRGAKPYLTINTCLAENIKPFNAGLEFSLGIIIHELLHVLGVPHTQVRRDAHEHITINWDNIIEDQHHNFMANHTVFDTHNVEYDCMSIMHYTDTQFQKKGAGLTMIPKHSNCDLHSLKNKLTNSDVELLKRMYNCF